MTTFSDAMHEQNVKVQAYLKPTTTVTPPPAGKDWQYKELLRIWDGGKDVCKMCHSERYADCISCGTSGVYTPVVLYPKGGGDHEKS